MIWQVEAGMMILEADLESMEAALQLIESVQVPRILRQMEWQSLQIHRQDPEWSWVVTWTVARKTECWL